MENNKKVINLNSSNQFVKFAKDKETLEFIYQQRKDLEKHLKHTGFSKASVEFLSILVLKIREFLTRKDIAKSWVDPFVNLITTGQVNYPLDNGINIKIDTYEARNKSRRISLSSHPEAKLVSDRSIQIVISANVNISQIKKFLDDNEDKIKSLMNELELPKTKPMPWKDTSLALQIIELRDDKGLSFEEIADLLGDKVKNDANAARKTYINYSKRFS